MARISAEVFACQKHECSFPLPAAAAQGAPETQNGRSGSGRLLGAFTATVRKGWMAAATAALLLSMPAARAQNTFAPVNVGSSVTQNVTVTARAAGVVATVEVLTSGAANLDFTAGSGAGTCAAATLAVSPAPTTCTQPVAFTPSAPGVRRGAVVLLDSNGNILATANLSGIGSGGLGVLVSGNILSIAGSGKYLDPVSGPGPASSAELYIPSSVTLDGAGNLYIADTMHNRIRMVCSGTTAIIKGVTCPGAGIIVTVAGNDTVGYDGDGGLAALASLDQPSGVALDGAGNLFIADTGNNVVREIYAATGIITTVAGSGVAGFAGDSLLAASTQTQLFQPQSIALDVAGNLYIADTDNQRIRRVDAVTGIITTAAGNGTAGYGGDGLVATSSNVELNFPRAVAFDPLGNWYIADSQNNRIRQVNASTGIITTFAGSGTPGFSGDKAAATAAELEAPSGVVVDPAGNVYIADTQNNAIRKVSSATGFISTIAKNGTGEFYSGGKFFPTTIYGPLGLFLDGSANLYFADSLNMVIREIQSNFVALDVFGITKTSVRQGSTSPTIDQTVENDGNAPLNLTPPDIFVDTADPLGFPNAELDTTQTTCPQSNPFLAAADDSCVIGAVFAPSLSLTFPTGTSTETLSAHIYVGTKGDTINSPLDIELVGVATALNSTSVKLTSSLNPSSFGQNVTFTAAVATGTGTLTGTVTFYDGATVLRAGVALTGGAAAYTTSALAVGLHTITAQYNGDSAHYASTVDANSTVKQVVNEATATTLISSANPSVLGVSVTFTATVTAPAGGGIPLDGTVTFTDTTAGTTLCAPALALNGTAYQAICVAPALTYGPHAITAAYSGDLANFITGSSDHLTQDVQAPSTTLLASAPNPSTFGNPVTFTVTVPTIGTVPATGTVSILETGLAAPLGTATLAGNPATGTFQTSSLAVGTYTITASYPGDSYYGPSTSNTVTQQVVLAQTTTTLSARPNPGIAGAPVAITATVLLADGKPAAGGTVTFTDTFNGATATLGTQALGSAGTAVISPLLAPGNHSIVATYSGTANAASSISSAYPLTVNQAVTSTVVTATPAPALVDTTVTLRATVTSIGGGTPTGTVTFSANGIQIGSPVALVAGSATITDSALAAATYTITAVYSGDTNDQASTGSTQLVVGTIPTVTTLGVSTTTGDNPQVILVAVVLNNATGSPATLPTPTGTVTFTIGTTTIGSAPLDSGGVATLTPNLASGTYSIVAAYGGDAEHSPSTSAPVSVSSPGTGFNLTVTPATVTMATGKNATVKVTLTSISGFSDTIGLGCGSLPSGVTCHFSSPSVKLPAGGAIDVSLTIDTNNPLGGGSSAMNRRPGSRGVSLAGLFLPLGVLFGFVFWRFRKRCPLAAAMALLLILGAGAQLVTGCSGFSQSTATPGAYLIQVNGVGANSDVSHYQNVSLTITAK